MAQRSSQVFNECVPCVYVEGEGGSSISSNRCRLYANFWVPRRRLPSSAHASPRLLALSYLGRANDLPSVHGSALGPWRRRWLSSGSYGCPLVGVLYMSGA